MSRSRSKSKRSKSKKQYHKRYRQHTFLKTPSRSVMREGYAPDYLAKSLELNQVLLRLLSGKESGVSRFLLERRKEVLLDVLKPKLQ